MAILGLLRLIRIKRLFTLLRKVEENIRLSHGIVMILKLLTMTVCLAHLEACGQWFFARRRQLGSDTWVGGAGLAYTVKTCDILLKLSMPVLFT
eukprot:scaffold173537_cov39-Prasinocladus_malaysianus.AAC.2